MYDKVLVLYPRGQKTGGPEALHQLVDALRRVGQAAYLVPAAGTEMLPRADAFAHYDAPEHEWEDRPGNAIVLPESHIDLLRNVVRADRFLWWLSIDNAPLVRAARRKQTLVEREDLAHLVSSSERVKESLRMWRSRRLSSISVLRGTHHLTQSHYAWSYLQTQFGLVASMLSDYTPPRFLAAEPTVSGRERTVLYNPVKSAQIMAEVASASTWSFMPLRGLTSDGVAAAMASAVMYVDLGTHPGKDRMPREAAASGAVVAVLRRGSGANSIDVPLGWDHKISPRGDVVANTLAVVDRVMADPATAWRAQEGYRRGIAGERDLFFQEAAEIFVRRRFESDSIVLASRFSS